MTVYLEGVRIELTAEQVALVEKARKKREKCKNSFAKTLLHFGFKKVDTSDWPEHAKAIGAYQHVYYDWYAEIYIHNEFWGEVWIVGNGLKHSSFPGGWFYGTPELAAAEIIKAIEKRQQTDGI